MDDTYRGWYPENPANLEFVLSVVGDASPAAPTGVSVTPSVDYHPLLQWEANTEPDLDGYKIYRHVRDWEPGWSQIGDVPGGTNYFVDYDYTTGHPGIGGPTSLGDYRVSAYDLVGTESKKSDSVTIKVLTPDKPYPTIPKMADSDLVDTNIPQSFEISGIYPNPFNARTTIRFGLPEAAPVNIEIYNISGQLVETILNESRRAGYHEIIWDASSVSSGIYLCKIKIGNFADTKSMVLLK